jgi:hypothetical protein
MSTATPPERDQQSFAETALRLGGKSEDEAPSYRCIGQSGRSSRKALSIGLSNGKQPHPQGGLGRPSSPATVYARSAARIASLGSGHGRLFRGRSEASRRQFPTGTGWQS